MSSPAQIIPQPHQALGKGAEQTALKNGRVIIVRSMTPRWMKAAVAALLVLVFVLIIFIATSKNATVFVTIVPAPAATTPPTTAPTPAPTTIPKVSTVASVAATSSALTGIAVTRQGDIYVSDSTQVFEIASGSTDSTVYAGAWEVGYVDGIGTNARFSSIQGIAVNADNVLYVADAGNKRIRSIAVSKQVETVNTGGSPYVVTVDSSGSVFVGDASTYYVLEIQKGAGQVIFVAYIPYLQAMAVSRSGTVYVSSQAKVYGLSSDGTSSTQFVYGYNSIAGLALSPSGEDLYIVDRDRHCIWALRLATSALSMIAGLCGSSGPKDGSPLSARFDTPSAIAVDTNGTIYVADGGRSYPRVRKLVL